VSVIKEYWPTPTTGAETIRQYGEPAERGGSAEDAAQAWSDAEFDDETASRWLAARCFDPQTARALADMGVAPEQAAMRTRDGGGYVDTIAFKVANGDLTVRQGAARSMSSR
jgi:photosystem II stability/assembly factor-like uncharacterized protein